VTPKAAARGDSRAAPAGLRKAELHLIGKAGQRDVEVSAPVQAKLMMARYYEASLGRFLSVDPRLFENVVEKGSFLRDPENWNRYVYGLNNPMQFKDVTGQTVVFTPAYQNALKTDPLFKANHDRFMSNREGKRVFGKLDRSKTTFTVDVATKTEIRSMTGQWANGVTQYERNPLPGPPPATVAITVNRSSGQEGDQVLYHEFRHGENAIDNAGNPYVRDVTDDNLDADPYGQKGLDLGFTNFNSFRPKRAGSSGSGGPGESFRSELGQMMEEADRRKKELEAQGKW